MDDNAALRLRVKQAYTPTRPISIAQFFSGRAPLLKRIMDAVHEPGRHPVIFGDRGVGKTSLANIAAAMMTSFGYSAAQVTCNTQSTFDEIFRSLFSQLTLTHNTTPPGFTSEPIANKTAVSDHLPSTPLTISAVVQQIRRFGDPQLLFVIDELDRAPADVTALLSDVIKTISDLGLRATLLLVGVADSLGDLIKNHPSIERNVEQVPLLPMTHFEITGIVENGEKSCSISFVGRAKRIISDLSQGYPYYAHLLCLHAALTAVQENCLVITTGHLKLGIEMSHQSVDRTIREAYNNAVASSRETSFADVLYAAAKAQTDEFGCFSPTDMTYVQAKKDGSYFNVNALQYPLSKLTSHDRGEILRRVGKSRRYKYRFANPMMRQYVLLRQSVDRGDIPD